jgi:hypothetical protein
MQRCGHRRKKVPSKVPDKERARPNVSIGHGHDISQSNAYAGIIKFIVCRLLNYAKGSHQNPTIGAYRDASAQNLYVCVADLRGVATLASSLDRVDLAVGELCYGVSGVEDQEQHKTYHPWRCRRCYRSRRSQSCRWIRCRRCGHPACRPHGGQLCPGRTLMRALVWENLRLQCITNRRYRHACRGCRPA